MGAQGTATLDYGATPVDGASVAVTGQAGILTGSAVEAWFMADTTADNGVDEHLMAGTLAKLTCGSIVAGTGFTIFADNIGLLATGQFSVRWVWN